MATYKMIELVGSSYVSWGEAAKEAIQTAAKTLHDLRVAEVTRMDLKVEDGNRVVYRVRMKVFFKILNAELFGEPSGEKSYAQEEE
jgi:hypothetical protein